LETALYGSWSFQNRFTDKATTSTTQKCVKKKALR
jgi:hypothetical protein